jgi:hypothetical protein
MVARHTTTPNDTHFRLSHWTDPFLGEVDTGKTAIPRGWKVERSSTEHGFTKGNLSVAFPIRELLF